MNFSFQFFFCAGGGAEIPFINGSQINSTNYEERFLISNFRHVMNVILHAYPPMKMEQTECSETSAYNFRRRRITRKNAYNTKNAFGYFVYYIKRWVTPISGFSPPQQFCYVQTLDLPVRAQTHNKVTQLHCSWTVRHRMKLFNNDCSTAAVICFKHVERWNTWEESALLGCYVLYRVI
jgi:hypothetical protein